VDADNNNTDPLALRFYYHPLCNERLILVRDLSERVYVFGATNAAYYGELGHPLTFRLAPVMILYLQAIVNDVRSTHKVDEYFYLSNRLLLPEHCHTMACIYNMPRVCVYERYNARCNFGARVPANELCECGAQCRNGARTYRSLYYTEAFYSSISRRAALKGNAANNERRLILPFAPLCVIRRDVSFNATAKRLLFAAAEKGLESEERARFVRDYCLECV
jgi:hypothetical protein